MEEILHHLIGSSSHYLQGFFTSQVVQDFFHQQYFCKTFCVWFKKKGLRWLPVRQVLPAHRSRVIGVNQPVIWEMVGYDPWVNPGPMCKRRSVASRFLQERNGFLCQCPRCQAEGCSPSEASGAHRHPTEVAFEKKNRFGTGERRWAPKSYVPVKNCKIPRRWNCWNFGKICPKLATDVIFFSPKAFFFSWPFS